MKLFKSKKQVEELKKVPLLRSKLAVSKSLELSSLKINYSITQVKPYYANIEYKEFPKQWTDDNNQCNTIQLTAGSWEELVDKVIEHFGSVDRSK